MPENPARLFLIDTFGLIFRAYHARARTGAPAMRTRSGMATEAVYIFNNMLRKILAEHHPEYVVAVFESLAPTFRDEIYDQYKANRAATPSELLQQIPYIRRLLAALGIPVIEHDRFEADDVIGALARCSAAKGLEVYIVSSDKDLLQLVGDHIFVLDPSKDNLIYDDRKVEEYMGVLPGFVADLLALKGDAVDNIPGAPGIGDKGARELVKRFGTVEQILDHAAEVERKTYRNSLLENRDRILLSKKLAVVDTSVPVQLDLEAVKPAPIDLARLSALYGELEFHSLLKDLPPVPQAPADYAGLETEEEVRAWLGDAPARGATVALSLDPLSGAEQIQGCRVGISVREAEARLAPLPAVRKLLEDAAVSKAVHDYKRAWGLLDSHGVNPAGVKHDTRLYTYLLDPSRSNYSLGESVLRRFGRPLDPGPAPAADFTWRLAGILAPEIDAAGLREVYENVELPLAPVLVRMERAGVAIDLGVLSRLSAEMELRLSALTAEIHRLAGREFNINSPQQLSKVLFEDLKLPMAGRSSKTKAPSTAAAVLEALAPDHEIVRKILDYRELAKLKGTYVDALPALVNPSTGRLHTTFDQCGSATGRLSSADPNLQNIPIRTELGRQIRAAFIPRPGWRLVVADYSQIELRVLAHVSQDAVLIQAFRSGEDIHTRTAAEVLGVPPLLVGPEERRRAKAINFGIVYGLSAFGLAAQLGISRTDAQRYIDGYFSRYAGVKRYIDSVISEVRRTGFTRTLFGRRRAIPDINSPNPPARNFAERTAVNSPIQGAAADLIKLAMISIDRRLRQEKFRAEMVLQVHDELLFEAPPEEVDSLGSLVKHEMESVRKLDVPLLIEIGVGENWRDAK
jgi:DNA polymerase-1